MAINKTKEAGTRDARISALMSRLSKEVGKYLEDTDKFVEDWGIFNRFNGVLIIKRELRKLGITTCDQLKGLGYVGAATILEF